MAEGFEEAREGRFRGGEESKGVLFEEDEEVEFEVVREVFAEERGEREVDEGGALVVGGGPPVEA